MRQLDRFTYQHTQSLHTKIGIGRTLDICSRSGITGCWL